MTKLTRKINVLLDEKTYRAFTAIVNIRNESPTKILRPAIEKYIREKLRFAGLPVIPVSKVGIQPVINGTKSTKKLFKLR